LIFVTVGSQMSFDRLIEQVDEWAGRRGRKDVFAQIGPSTYIPRNIEAQAFISPDAFRARVEQAEAVVAHAGMGTIIEALQRQKPLLVFPRLGALGETRNDHQTATARRFAESGRLLAAYSEEELIEKLEKLAEFRPPSAVGPTASPALLDRVRRFVFEQ